jgi:hypothetical protein
VKVIPHSAKTLKIVRLSVWANAAVFAIMLVLYVHPQLQGAKKPSGLDALLVGIFACNTILSALALYILGKRPYCIIEGDSISVFKFLRWVKIGKSEIQSATFTSAEITIASRTGRTFHFESIAMDGADWEALRVWVQAATPVAATTMKSSGMTHSVKMAIILVPISLAIACAVIWPFVNAESQGVKSHADGIDWLKLANDERKRSGTHANASAPPPTKPAPLSAEQLHAIYREYDAATNPLERELAMEKLEQAIISSESMSAESRSYVRKYIDAEGINRVGKLNALYALVRAKDTASLEWLMESALKEQDPRTQKKLVRTMDMLDRKKAQDLIGAQAKDDERHALLQTFLTRIEEQKPGTTATDE